MVRSGAVDLLLEFEVVKRRCSRDGWRRPASRLPEAMSVGVLQIDVERCG